MSLPLPPREPIAPRPERTAPSTARWASSSGSAGGHLSVANRASSTRLTISLASSSTGESQETTSKQALSRLDLAQCPVHRGAARRGFAHLQASFGARRGSGTSGRRSLRCTRLGRRGRVPKPGPSTSARTPRTARRLASEGPARGSRPTARFVVASTTAPVPQPCGAPSWRDERPFCRTLGPSERAALPRPLHDPATGKDALPWLTPSTSTTSASKSLSSAASATSSFGPSSPK